MEWAAFWAVPDQNEQTRWFSKGSHLDGSSQFHVGHLILIKFDKFYRKNIVHDTSFDRSGKASLDCFILLFPTTPHKQ
jgi:hypothetical protein